MFQAIHIVTELGHIDQVQTQPGIERHPPSWTKQPFGGAAQIGVPDGQLADKPVNAAFGRRNKAVHTNKQVAARKPLKRDVQGATKCIAGCVEAARCARHKVIEGRPTTDTKPYLGSTLAIGRHFILGQRRDRKKWNQYQ